MQTKHTILALSLLMLAGFKLQAQNSSGFSAEQRDTAQKRINRTSITPGGNGSLSNVFSSFSLSSKLNAGTDGKAELKYQKHNYLGGLDVTQTLGKGEDQATLFDFMNGFKSGTKIGFNLQRTGWIKARYSKEEKKFLDTAISRYLKKHPGLKDYEVSEQDLADPADLKRLKEFKATKIWVWNLKVAFTKTKFSYATDSLTLKKLDETHFRPDISFSAGLPLDKISYLSLTYNYSESFDASDKTEFLKPFGTTKNLISQSIAFGKPKYINDHKVMAEYRRLLFDANFAISPSIFYGIRSEKIAIALPVYFIKNTDADGKSQGLQGGISAGYLSSVNKLEKFKDGFAAQLFVSAPFSLFKAL